MSALAILSLALAVMALGVVVVCVRVLVQSLRRLSGAVKAVSERIAPLTAELSDELAITSAEVSNLTDGLERIRAERAAAKRRRQGIKLRDKPGSRRALATGRRGGGSRSAVAGLVTGRSIGRNRR